MNVFDSLDALVVDLCLQVFFGDFLAQLLSTVNSFQAFALLKSRCVDILFFSQSECEDAVKQSLKELVKLFLLITKQGFVNDI